MENKTQPPKDEQFDLEAYRIATNEEKRNICAEEYDLLLGPNNFDCCLTEPEDRNFHRDLAPLVKLLNKQHLEILKAQSQQAQREKQVAQAAFEGARDLQQIIEHSDSGVSYVTGMIEVYPDFASYWAEQQGEG